MQYLPQCQHGLYYMCNGYGIWINKDKLRWGLITFNRLPEPWRASPESWHLSRYYYIYSSITFIHVENISWELALKPGYCTIIVQYTKINVRPGNNRLPHTKDSRPGKTPTFRAFPRTSSLARGKYPHTAHFRLARSPHPVGHRVSGTSPKAGLASGKFPTRQRCLPCDPTRWLFLNTQLGRVSH